MVLVFCLEQDPVLPILSEPRNGISSCPAQLQYFPLLDCCCILADWNSFYQAVNAIISTNNLQVEL